MIVIDTETTGLWWQHNTKTFAIGVYDGDFQSYYVPVSPFTREPEEKFRKIKGIISTEVGYCGGNNPVSYTHLTLPTNREV